MAQHFEIAVVGTGPGGYVAALKAAQMGASVAVIERHPFFGGTCLNWGCIPSKALIASAELVHHIKHASQMGVEVGGPVRVDWTKIQGRKDKILKTLRGGVASLFDARKVTSFQGRGIVEGPGRIAVTREGAEAETLTADKIILAVGSTPAMIPGWPEDRNVICTSDEALHWADLPQRLLIVGGGVIGCEFACMLRAMGVEVTLVEMMPKLLPGMDGHIADALAKVFAQRGIKCYLGAKVSELTIGEGGGTRATLDSGEVIENDRVLVATGRRPATDGLGLESVGLATDRGFLRVDDHMETPVKGIYCVGDANGRCLLAHAASAHGVAAVENALGHPTEFTAPIASCVYTFPEIAAVGLTAEEARAQGIPVAIGSFPMGHLGKSMAVGQTEGFVKVIRHRESNELLGVHMMGHNVTEVIATAGAMMHQKLSVKDVAATVFAHPTISEAFGEAAEDVLGMALHLPPRKVIRV
jgi:dihydrolipoamide dehydrogenase